MKKLFLTLVASMIFIANANANEPVFDALAGTGTKIASIYHENLCKLTLIDIFNGSKYPELVELWKQEYKGNC